MSGKKIKTIEELRKHLIDYWVDHSEESGKRYIFDADDAQRCFENSNPASTYFLGVDDGHDELARYILELTDEQ
jgi:hypothetical protein